MENSTLLTLKIYLPYRVFGTLTNITSVVAETAQGSYGILPRRLDGVAALVPGILSYTLNTGEVFYIAVDEGVLIKERYQISVSVRNAMAGSDLGKLHELVNTEFKNISEQEVSVRSTLAKLESGFMEKYKKLQGSK